MISIEPVQAPVDHEGLPDEQVCGGSDKCASCSLPRASLDADWLVFQRDKENPVGPGGCAECSTRMISTEPVQAAVDHEGLPDEQVCVGSNKCASCSLPRASLDADWLVFQRDKENPVGPGGCAECSTRMISIEPVQAAVDHGGLPDEQVCVGSNKCASCSLPRASLDADWLGLPAG